MANGMDSPKREPYLPGCDLQGSPLFKFLCSLSPIKQAKAAHVAQTYSELSFPAPLPVFVSPPAKVKREVVEERPESSVTVDVSGKQTMVQNDAEMTDKLAVSSETTEERTLETVEDRCLPTTQNHRGPRRRCLDFQESQSSSIENPVASSIPASMFCEEACEDLEEEMYQEQQEDTPTTSTSCSDSFAAENLMALAQLSSDPACGLSSESCKQKQVLPDSIPTSIGLHLNALTSGLGMLTGQRGIYNLPGAALNLGPGLLLSVVEKTRMDQQEFRGSAEEGFKSSTTCVRSLTLGIQALEEGVSFGVDKVITPGRKRLSLSDSLEGEPTRTPKKKRKSLGKDAGDGCKRCHCKKSKCLKLYCECFAAGVYCLDSCACRDCFNKPEFSETVLGTRQQIETRNPLAFAPKIVQTAESTPAEGVPCPETSSSARHKRGCNCKKSLCLKKYCECYQAGVGCSDGCRCNGCKNLYGIKKVQDEADQLEDQTMSVTSISPITPTFQQAPPLDILPLESSSCDLSKIYESAGLMGCELTQTPSSPPAASMVEGMETPEFLRDERCSPRTVIQGSPNKKRVVPPNTGPPSSVLKSGRKLTLQTLPSLPPVTPFSFAQQQGYKRSSYNT